MDNHLPSSSAFLFENTNDLVFNLNEDVLSSSPNQNENLSLSPPSSSDTSIISERTYPCCIFYCKQNSHPFQERCIPLNDQAKVGRAVAKLKALSNNAIFDCKVLSRQHAKLWYENGKFLLQDTKSSNGTFVNNQRLGKCNEESQPYEIYSGDIIQFGVDVMENNRKTTHNCIIMEVRLFHTDGNEALSRSAINQSLGQIKDFDLNAQVLYQLAQYIQEAMQREQALEQKLEYLQGTLRDTQQTSNDSWQAIIHEDRLLTRINTLEDQLRIYRTKNFTDDMVKQELVQLTESHRKFEEESKRKLEKILNEHTDTLSHNKFLQTSLQTTKDELKSFENQYEESKQDIQQYIQSLDEQRLLIADYEIKFQESQRQCTELENEKQRIQSEFDQYYQRTQHLENEINQNELEVQTPIKDLIKENGEIENHHPMMDIINHNHNHKNDGLTEAQKQIILLREQLNETNECLVSSERSCRVEQERYRTLTMEHENLGEELNQLKSRIKSESNETNDLVEQQQNELVHLSKSILSKQLEHDQLLSVYICFFLSCYLMIFFLFFFLLPW